MHANRSTSLHSRARTTRSKVLQVTIPRSCVEIRNIEACLAKSSCCRALLNMLSERRVCLVYATTKQAGLALFHTDNRQVAISSQVDSRIAKASGQSTQMM